MKSSSYDVMILGGGIAGLGVAIPLARAGKKVLVIEKKLKGRSTPAAGGILDPFLDMRPGHPLLPLGLKAFREYPARIRALARRTQVDVGYKKTGMFYAAFNRAEQMELKKREAWQKKTGIPVRWRSAKQILKREPALEKNILGGLDYPAIARIQPKKLLQALERDARLAGVHFGASPRPSSITVNATGSWAGLQRALPILPIKGQIEIIRSGLKIKTILHTVNGGYIVPWGSGSYLLGSTVEFAGYDAKVTTKGLQEIRKRTEKLVPGIRSAKTVETWSGLRPYSKTGLPLIGPASKRGHYLACGFYRSGILIGMTAGELLAKSILTGKTPKMLKPFEPGNHVPKN